jgi:hypothetical protein
MDKIQWIKDNRHVCIQPQSTYNFVPNEKQLKISCCCNLDIDSAKELDTEFIDNIADNLIQKTISPACHVCYTDEDRNLMSERMRNLLDFSESELLQIENGKSNHNTISIKFSNLCNSACRSCDQYNSSLWATTFAKKGTYLPKSITDDLSDHPTQWPTILSAIEKKYLKSTTAQIKNSLFFVNLIGGETLLQKGFYRLVDWLIDKGMASKTWLRITTGATVLLDENTVQKFLMFNKVSFSLSIDTVGDNFQYTRWPAKFSKIETVLDQLIQLKNQHSRKIEIYITPVFSVNNIFYIKEYLDWWLNWMTSNQPVIIMPINLYRPTYFDLCNLPDPYRQQLIDILNPLVNHPLFLQTDSVTMKTHLGMITESLINGSGNDAEFVEYLKQTARFDKITKISSTTGNNKLFDLLLDEHRQLYQDFYKQI